MGDIGFSEILLIMFVALLLYGKELPQIARKVGSSYAKFRSKMRDIQDEIMREVPDVDVQREIEQAGNSPSLPPPTESEPTPQERALQTPAGSRPEEEISPKPAEPQRPSSEG